MCILSYEVCDSVFITNLQCNFEILQKKIIYVLCFHFYIKFLYTESDDGPKGMKCVAYMKIHSCVKWYLPVY
jgi:hypothetical protein